MAKKYSSLLNHKSQNTDSIPPRQQWAMSLFRVNGLKLPVCASVCLLTSDMIGQTGVRSQHTPILSFLFVSAMQST